MKNNRILIFASTLALLGSCSTEKIENEGEIDSGKENFNAVTENGLAHVCLDVSDVLPAEEDNQAGKALVKRKLWENGQTITVKFIGGSTSLQNRVITQAKVWEDYANIKFQVVTSDDADLRVSFEQNGSSYSYIGTDAKRINQSQETMNFGWFTDRSSDSEIRRTTLHEFGHALGAIHEQSSPDVDIQWDVDEVYRQYAERGWSQSQVDSNLFAKYSTNDVTNSEYDPLSIMHYPINNSLTLNDFSVGFNTELSAVDKEFIGKTYPFPDTTPTEPTEPTEPTDPTEPAPVSGDNVALGRSTSQSSTAYSGVSGRAVDGNTDGVWRNGSITHTATTSQPWWKVDLDTTTSIDKVIIYNRTDSCCSSRLSSFYVDALSETGAVIGSLLVSDPPSPSLTIRGNGINAKSIRIRLVGTNPLSLAEVQVIKK